MLRENFSYLSTVQQAESYPLDQYGMNKSSVIPEPLAPEFEIDNNKELFKETLLVMRIKLGSDQMMFSVINTLYTVL
jgi:hypothetical protein